MKVDNFKCDRTEYSAVLLEDKVILIGGDNNDWKAVNNTVCMNWD